MGPQGLIKMPRGAQGIKKNWGAKFLENSILKNWGAEFFENSILHEFLIQGGLGGAGNLNWFKSCEKDFPDLN